MSAINDETAARTPDGFQSKTTAMNCPVDRRPLDNLESGGRTRFWDRIAGAPDADWDALDSRGIYDRLGVPLRLSPSGTSGGVAKNQAGLVKSPMTVKVALLDFRKRVRVPLKFRFDPIHQSGEGRTRAGVADDSFPSRVPVQFRHQPWQILRQFLPFIGRERADGGFDFLDGVHDAKLRQNRDASKLAFGTAANGSQTSPQIANRKSKIKN